MMKRWMAALWRLTDRGIATPDGSLFLAAHEGAHAVDLDLSDCRTATIHAALMALPHPARLRSEGVAIAASMLVCEWAGGGWFRWTREGVVDAVIRDARRVAADTGTPRPRWTGAHVDAALDAALAESRTREIAYRVARGDVPWPAGAWKGVAS